MSWKRTVDWKARNRYLAARFDTCRTLLKVYGFSTPELCDQHLFWIPA